MLYILFASVLLLAIGYATAQPYQGHPWTEIILPQGNNIWTNLNADKLDGMHFSNFSNRLWSGYDMPTNNIWYNDGGKVGIGTSNPQAKLDISGAVKIGFQNICDTNTEGTIRYNSNKKVIEFCDGNRWKSMEGTKKGLAIDHFYINPWGGDMSAPVIFYEKPDCKGRKIAYLRCPISGGLFAVTVDGRRLPFGATGIYNGNYPCVLVNASSVWTNTYYHLENISCGIDYKSFYASASCNNIHPKSDCESDCNWNAMCINGVMLSP